MISLLVILLIILNLSIFLTFDKFAKIINVYDTPDKKLKLHSVLRFLKWRKNTNEKKVYFLAFCEC